MPLKDIRKAAAIVGATVIKEREGGSNVLRIEAPHGYIWNEGDVHEIVDEAFAPWQPDYADALSRMGHGLKPCPYGADCDWCNPEGGA